MVNSAFITTNKKLFLSITTNKNYFLIKYISFFEQPLVFLSLFSSTLPLLLALFAALRVCKGLTIADHENLRVMQFLILPAPYHRREHLWWNGALVDQPYVE